MAVKFFADRFTFSTSLERLRQAFAAVGTVVDDPAGQSCQGGH